MRVFGGPQQAATASGKPVGVIPVDANGVVDLGALEELLHGPKALVSVMLANNETGVMQPVAEIVRLAAEREPDLLVTVDNGIAAQEALERVQYEAAQARVAAAAKREADIAAAAKVRG